MKELALMLECIGPVQLTDNLRGARWSKLAINCAISSIGTVGGDRLGNLLANRFIRRLALEVMTEVVEVARAEDVTLVKVAGTFDLQKLALTPPRKSLGRLRFADQKARASIGRWRSLPKAARSSMLSAIRAWP